MRVLKEDTFEQAVARDADVVKFKGDVEEALDEALENAEDAQITGSTEYDNILLIGGAGVGKTSRARAWASLNHINLVYLDAKQLDETDLGGALAPDLKKGKAVKLSTDTLDLLDKPNSVLFLDELNRARANIRGTLLSLINEHYIYDAHQEGGLRKFDNLLFTIAAINPPNAAFANVDRLDPAELGRFRSIHIYADKKNVLDHLNDVFNKEIEKTQNSNAPEDKKNKILKKYEGRKNIAEIILKNSQFDFDGEEEEEAANLADSPSCSPRSFTRSLTASNGTKDDFIKKFKQECGEAKVPVITSILANYKDIDDKANSVFKDDKGEDIAPGFAEKEDSIFDRLVKNGTISA